MILGGGLGDVWVPWKADGSRAKRYHHAFTVRELRGLFDSSDWEIERCEPWGKDHAENILNGRNLLLVAKRKAPPLKV